MCVDTNNLLDKIRNNKDTVYINNILLTKETELMDHNGKKFYIHEQSKIGSGSYGSVYLLTDETGKKYAVKICDMDIYGIPNILEASIMSSINHPHLNRTVYTLTNENKLYLVQELAVGDLFRYLQKFRNTNSYISLDNIKKWCFEIASAVYALHKDNIIHADIKSSNILLYENNNVRLTDFSLATKMWEKNDKFRHHICTCTHRPLECWLGRPWDMSVDIWSLGCTFYEIAYGELLFPNQATFESVKHENKELEHESKIRTRRRNINCLLDWNSQFCSNDDYVSNLRVKYHKDLNYKKIKLNNKYNLSNMSLFNDLLHKMLVMNPQKRINIVQVLNHPFFTNLKLPKYLSITRPLNELSLHEDLRVRTMIDNNSSTKLFKPEDITNKIYLDIIKDLAYKLYCKCINLNYISEDIRSATCVWISSKLVLGTPPNTFISQDIILQTERIICSNLSFLLHYSHF